MRQRILNAGAALALALGVPGCATSDPGPVSTSATPTSPVATFAMPTKTPAPPEEIFIKHGCPTCHAKGAPHEDKLAAAVGKPVEEAAAWIRNPERKKPGTVMPTFASRIDETEARSLAAWVQREAAAGTVMK